MVLKQFMNNLFKKYDRSGDGFLRKMEFLFFSKELIRALNKKHKGDITIPDAIIDEAWDICRECFGNAKENEDGIKETPGVSLADFRKMMYAYHKIQEKKFIIDSVDNIISNDL